jgi:CheY-like chemotaxis protein
VDDEEDIRDVVQAVLESRGAHVLTAADGPAGIERFREHADDVDVVLLDMTMPGLGGDAVFREILSIKPDARVIISSGYSQEDTLARLDDKRLAGFVHKPYTAQLLIDEINTVLEAPVS